MAKTILAAVKCVAVLMSTVNAFSMYALAPFCVRFPAARLVERK
jgi:hypothetical protein